MSPVFYLQLPFCTCILRNNAAMQEAYEREAAPAQTSLTNSIYSQRWRAYGEEGQGNWRPRLSHPVKLSWSGVTQQTQKGNRKMEPWICVAADTDACISVGRDGIK